MSGALLYTRPKGQLRMSGALLYTRPKGQLRLVIFLVRFIRLTLPSLDSIIPILRRFRDQLTGATRRCSRAGRRIARTVRGSNGIAEVLYHGARIN